jgi:PhoPQ-activated pathogenicity-related protein
MPLPTRILRKTTKRLLRRVIRRFGGIGLSPALLHLEILEDRTLMSAGLTALDAYVAASDPSYTYSLNSTITGTGYTDYVINLTSQTWRSSADVDKPVWQHWLQIIVPTHVTRTTAVLEITGGSNTAPAPSTADSIGLQTATALGAVTVVLPDVPSEPLTFTDETTPRTEDQIVAYTENKYLNGGDPNWPLLLPMVKSAVRAMDTTQSFVSSQFNGTIAINDFIVSGASKRGWTTWLTPAVDSRIRAIVPFVFDISNFDQNVPHLKDTYVGVTQNIVGGYPVSVQDYTNLNIFDRLGTPQGQALDQIVDPFSYFGRSTYNIPKYLVDSAGDQFFVPDASQYYFGALPGQNYIRYVPNTGHSLNSDAVTAAINFEKVLLDGVPLPRFSWNVTDFGTTITVHTIDAPSTVKMWQATNPNNRDFRIDSFGANYTSSTLTDQGGGTYVAHVNAPATGATAFFAELTYNVDGVTLTFTTQADTVPLFTPMVAASDAGGVYKGNAYAAAGNVTGRSGFQVAGTSVFTYYAGDTVNGSGTTTPPTNAGTYTVVASFTSNDPSYINGQSAPVTFTISPSIVLSSGILTITGDGNDNAINVSLSDSGAIDVTVDGTQQHFDAGAVSSVVVDGGGGTNSLTVDDSNTASAQSYTLTATGVSRSNAQPIAYTNVQDFVLDAGNFGNTIDWQGTSDAASTVYSGSGANTINFGDSNNTLDSFCGTPTLYGQGTQNTVNVHDQGTTAPRHYVISPTALSPNDGKGFGYGYGVQTANLYFGSGGNTIDWQGVAAGEAVTVHTGAGANIVNLGDANNTLDGFVDSAAVVGEGIDTVNIDDQGSATAHDYALTSMGLSRDAKDIGITTVEAVNCHFGTGSNSLNWQVTSSAATAYSADFSGGSTQVQGAFSAAATRINGAVAMTGSVPAFGALTVTSQGSLDLSQATGAITADSVSNQGSITGSGHLSLADSGDFASGNLDMVLGGTTYDQVLVGGTASLSGALVIGLTPGFVPTGGQTFTILHDTAGTAINGSFTGRPDGTLFPVSGLDNLNQPFTATFRVNYTGGDVVLTDVGAPQVASDNADVAVVVGQTATNTGSWSQPGFAGADTITASIGTITQTGSNGSGTWSWSYPTSATAQSQTVTISADDGRGDVATTTFSLAVNEAGTSTSVRASVNPAVFGQIVTFTATARASAPGAGLPTGAVTFKDFGTAVGTATLDGSGKATFSTAALARGNHAITATYGADANFSTSTSIPFGETVSKDGTSTNLTSTPNPSVFGQLITFTAIVSANAPGAGTPTGNVTFEEGTAVLGSGTLRLVGGNYLATLITKSLSAASHVITAVYNGDGNFNSSTGDDSGAPQTVNKDASITTLKASPNSTVFGQPVILTASVFALAPGSGTPSGTVTFKDGAATLGTGSLSTLAQATFSTAGLARGNHAITAVYGGDGGFLASTSINYGETVAKDTTTTALSSAPNRTVFGQFATFTATLSANAPGAGTPTGTVTFKEGSTVLGSSILQMVGGVDSATFRIKTLTVGSHTIVAVYNGDNNFQGSTADDSALPQVVNTAATTTGIRSSLNPSVVGNTVTFTATVRTSAPGSGIGTGTVTFKDFGNILGTGSLDGTGVATFTTSSLAVGNHAISAAYGGDTNFSASTSIAFGEKVTPSLAAAQSLSSGTLAIGAQEATVSSPTAEVRVPGLIETRVDHFFARAPAPLKLRASLIEEDWLWQLV